MAFDRFLTKEKRTAAAALFGALLLVSSAQAKRPLNPRKFKNKARLAAELAASTATAHVVVPRKIPRLPAGRWDPAVKNELEEFIADHSSAAAAYDSLRPPVAVLPWNDALVIGDAGSAVFQKLVEGGDFKFNEEFWGLVPLEYGRQRLRAAYEIFTTQPVSVWASQGEYQQYRKDFFAAYRDMCVKVGRGECRAWLSRLFAGFTEEELARYVQGALREELLREPEEELVYAFAEDKVPLHLKRGMAPVPEMRALVELLLRCGFDVWVIDTDTQRVLEVAAKAFGIDPSRVEGTRLGMAMEKLTSEIVSPIPIRAGKVDVAASMIGRPPMFVVGTKAEDEQLLRYSTGLRLVLGGDASLRRAADDGGWLVQPAFILYHSGVPSPRRGE